MMISVLDNQRAYLGYENEQKLVDHLLLLESRGFGLTPKKVIRLA